MEPQATTRARVLVVDDEPAMVSLVRTMLWRAGFEVLEAGSGEEALELLKAQAEPVGLLLTDVMMPGMTGCDLAEQVRALRPEIRVLFMTGYRDREILDGTGSEVPARVLRKPFTAFTLVSWIEETLAGG